MSDERCALVLEGGAMRGMYTAGVLDCFMDHDISFDAVIGVSAGALFGVNPVSYTHLDVYKRQIQEQRMAWYVCLSTSERRTR